MLYYRHYAKNCRNKYIYIVENEYYFFFPGGEKIELQYFFWSPRILNIIHIRNVPVRSREVLICLYLLLISHRLHINFPISRNPSAIAGLYKIYFKFNSIAVVQKKRSKAQTVYLILQQAWITFTVNALVLKSMGREMDLNQKLVFLLKHSLFK